ncbi:MAG TPA: beta-N-acetylhexosaminidase [Chthoniobacteraceae bacterium]|nr:beta-N-acetylhexosaminidase [Chthoniobacteraceae bacterium]
MESLLSIATTPSASALLPALEQVRRAFPWRFGVADAVEITFHQEKNNTSGAWQLVSEADGRWRVNHARPCDAFRALGRIMGELELKRKLQPMQEESAFETLGVMLDLSRNAVLRVESIRRLIGHFALMGINRLFLYMEDGYPVGGEPLLGYFRGRYSADELRAIDEHAALFDMEVIPFIQTLGHLRHLLQWPCYAGLQDTPEVLLTGTPEVETLIEKMIAGVTACFRSRRIHLGMDEAHGIGTGRHQLKHGPCPPFEILSAHLGRIVEICKRRGLSPMIWSDMFFRLGSKTNDYYDPESLIPDRVAEAIPAQVDLVYWDYYHLDPAFYREWIRRHRKLGSEPHFAAGAWTWNRFWTALPRSFATLKAGMEAARAERLKHAFVTLWGDNGAECSPFSALPAIQLFAHLGWHPDRAEADLAVHLKGSAHVDSEAWIAASALDHYPALGDPAVAIHNTGKWLLWHDPLLNHLECHIAPSLPAHYDRLEQTLATAVGNGERYLELIRSMAAVLARKVRLHLQLRSAYRQKNLSQLREIADRDLPLLVTGIRQLWRDHRTRWHEENKPFGWEVMERRYGGLLLRLETLGEKLARHLADPDRYEIEELACEPQPVYPPETLAHLVIPYQRTSSPSLIV